jgi:hypothetical protein
VPHTSILMCGHSCESANRSLNSAFGGDTELSEVVSERQDTMNPSSVVPQSLAENVARYREALRLFEAVKKLNLPTIEIFFVPVACD